MRRLLAVTVGVLLLSGCASVVAPPVEDPDVAASITVPDVVGMAGDAARDAVEDAGMDVEWDAGDDSVWKASNWTVDAQVPAAGAAGAEGDVVTLTVSKPESAAVPSSDLPKRVQDALQTAWGVDEMSELLVTMPESLAGYIVDFEAPTNDTIVLTVQVNKANTTEGELDQFALNTFSLIGAQLEDLGRVEVRTADSLLRGVANRHEVPLLNL